MAFVRDNQAKLADRSPRQGLDRSDLYPVVRSWKPWRDDPMRRGAELLAGLPDQLAPVRDDDRLIFPPVGLLDK
jgi:hypothetical protein